METEPASIGNSVLNQANEYCDSRTKLTYFRLTDELSGTQVHRMARSNRPIFAHTPFADSAHGFLPTRRGPVSGQH